MKKKEIKPQINYPPQNIPYRDINKAFRFGFVIPGKGIKIEQDTNGVLFISSESGMDVSDIVAGDNIELTRTDDGKIVVSAINSITNIADGQNVSVDIDPETGTAIINTIVDGTTDEHFQGIFDTPRDLMDYDTDPEQGDYGLIKKVTYSDGGEQVWNGEYKYCFWIDGTWTVVDQMLTFSSDTELLKQFYSVGGGSPVIYLHTVAKTGDFNDLDNKPIVATPEVAVEGSTVTATCETEGAEIHYTTDGSMPHAGSTLYSGPITVSAQSSFRFVAIKNGMINSEEAVAYVDYELQQPVIDLDFQTGEISMTNPNQSGDIYYTTDGTTPTSSSNLYTGPFEITTQTRIKAIVINTNDNHESAVAENFYRKLYLDHRNTGGNSIIGTAIYYIEAKPTGEVHYTDNGDTPDYESPVLADILNFEYYGGVKNIKTRAFAPGYIPSDIDSYSVGAEKPVEPPIYYNPDTNKVSLIDYIGGDGTYGYIDGLYGEYQAGETSEGKTPLTSYEESDSEPNEAVEGGDK